MNTTDILSDPQAPADVQDATCHPVPVRRVFLDTQIWVHFAAPKDLDLPALVGADRIVVVVPETTIRELDKLKSTGRSRKVRDRAVAALRAIETATETGCPIDGGIEVEYMMRTPSNQLTENGLDATWADDVLVASVLACHQDHPDEPPPVLVSDDTGPGMKCRHLGVGCVKPNPAHRRQDADPEQQEIAQLRREVQRMKDAVPRPVLAFVGGSGKGCNTRIVIRPEQSFDEDARRADILERFPDMSDRGSLVAGNRVSEDQVTRYNDDLEKFRRCQLRYETSVNEIENLRRLFTSLKLEVLNTGTAPAEDVRVILRFPVGMKVWLAEDPPNLPEPTAPTAPERPHPSSLFGNIRESSLEMSHLLHRPQVPTVPVPEPALTVDDGEPSSRVHGRLGRVMHGVPSRLPEIVAVVHDASSFSIGFELHTANRPEKVSGTLNIRVEEPDDEA